MSHQVESMAFANAVPWHGLGARIDSSATVDEMLVAAGLDWKVEQHPMFAKVGEEYVPTGRQALIRDKDKRVMTITGDNWHPVQNAEILETLRRYVESGGATLETAGSLRGGKVVWALANLDHEFEVRRGDKVRGYLLLTTYHEVGKATRAATTTVRVVCANTLAQAESNMAVNYRQNHMSEFDISAAQESINSAHEQLVIEENNFKSLAKFKLDLNDAMERVFLPAFEVTLDEGVKIEQVLAEVKLLPKSLGELIDSYHLAPGAEPGTGWGALNAVTHWGDHVAGRDNSTRMYRSWCGDVAVKKQKVKKLLLEMI